MRVDDPNLPQLRQIAEALGDLREQVVFVGGAVAGLLVTDPLADPVRATRDVDAVVSASRTKFYRIEEAVAQRGFARDMTREGLQNRPPYASAEPSSRRQSAVIRIQRLGPLSPLARKPSWAPPDVVIPASTAAACAPSTGCQARTASSAALCSWSDRGNALWNSQTAA